MNTSDEEACDECAVCTEAPWDPVRLTTCGHVFCRRCLIEVARRGGDGAARCPLCRQPLPASGCDSGSDGRLIPSWLARAVTDLDVERRMRLSFPDVYERRREEAEQRLARCICIAIGNRCVHGTRTARLQPGVPIRHEVTLFADVVPPPSLADSIAATDLASMLVDGVRFVLPEEGMVPESVTAAELEPDDEGIVDVPCAPYEVSFRVLDEVGAPRGLRIAVTVVVVWKRRLKLEPLVVEHEICVDEGGATARHEVDLPNGLTVTRIVERTQPKARVGAQSAQETRIY